MILFTILAIEDERDRELMLNVYVDLYPLMKSTAYKIVKDYSIAEDMVHDAMTKLIDKLDTIRGLESYSLVSYISRTVRNISINYYNRNIGGGKISFYGLEDEELEDIPDYDYMPDEVFELKADYDEVGQAMEQLPERDRDILYLKYNCQASDQEISEIMGIRKNSVRQYLTRARRNAKECIMRGGD